MKKVDISEILASGTPKQKALLVIEDNLAKERNDRRLLSDRERDAIANSFKNKPMEYNEYCRYIDVAFIFEQNRFRIFALQESINKLAAALRGYLNILELSEHFADISNNLLDLVAELPIEKSESKKLEDFVYSSGKGWSRYLSVKKVAGKKAVDTDTRKLQDCIKDILSSYTSDLSAAKGLVIASEEFIAKCNAAAFVPSDVREMLDSFKKPNTLIPAAYQRGEYLRLLKLKGEDDIEVQIAKTYAIVPAYEEVEAYGLENLRHIFNESAVLYAK